MKQLGDRRKLRITLQRILLSTEFRFLFHQLGQTVRVARGSTDYILVQ